MRRTPPSLSCGYTITHTCFLIRRQAQTGSVHLNGSQGSRPTPLWSCSFKTHTPAMEEALWRPENGEMVMCKGKLAGSTRSETQSRPLPSPEGACACFGRPPSHNAPPPTPLAFSQSSQVNSTLPECGRVLDKGTGGTCSNLPPPPQLITIMDRYKLEVISAGKNYTRIRKAICSGYFAHAAKVDPQEGYVTLAEQQTVYIRRAPGLAAKCRGGAGGRCGTETKLSVLVWFCCVVVVLYVVAYMQSKKFSIYKYIDSAFDVVGSTSASGKPVARSIRRPRCSIRTRSGCCTTIRGFLDRWRAPGGGGVMPNHIWHEVEPPPQLCHAMSGLPRQKILGAYFAPRQSVCRLVHKAEFLRHD